MVYTYFTSPPSSTTTIQVFIVLFYNGFRFSCCPVCARILNYRHGHGASSQERTIGTAHQASASSRFDRQCGHPLVHSPHGTRLCNKIIIHVTRLLVSPNAHVRFLPADTPSLKNPVTRRNATRPISQFWGVGKNRDFYPLLLLLPGDTLPVDSPTRCPFTLSNVRVACQRVTSKGGETGKRVREQK